MQQLRINTALVGQAVEVLLTASNADATERQVQIDLDADTRFNANLMLHHITSINPESRGVRLGCEFVDSGAEMERSMQRFIDQTQKRRRLMSLD